MLLIDAGNSAIKTRLINVRNNAFDDQVFATLNGVAQSGLSDYLASITPDRIVLASVARGENQRDLLDAIKKSFPAAQFTQLKTLPALGEFNNAYPDHRQLGVDRWLAAVAAHEIAVGDAIILDAGTALKVELVSKRRGYLGGVILPGFNTGPERFRALFPQLDFASEVVCTDYLPGVSTAQCVRPVNEPLGCPYLFELIGQAQSQLENPVVLLSGQDAARVAECLSVAIRHIPDLVFRGMLKQMQCLG